MKRYPISTEFGIFAHFRPPFFKAMLPVVQRAMVHCDRTLRKDPDISVSEHTIQNGVRLLVIGPKRARHKLPCLLFYHGGAFAMPAYNYHYRVAAQYAKELPCKVVFADYRLLPRYRYPSQLEDSLNALAWVKEHADELIIDGERVAVCGDSAGGQLAALTAFYAKEKYDVDLTFQMLIYPAIDPAMRTESMRGYTDTPMWNAKLNKRMWRWYLDEDDTNFPSLLDADIPCCLPPAYIEAAEFDCLHDECAAYADKLQKSGVSVTFRETKGTMHGFEMVECDTTAKAVRGRVEFMSEMWNANKRV